MIARRTLLAATLATPALAKPALAQSNTEWPDRPVRILIGFGAGGVSDVATRQVLAEELRFDGPEPQRRRAQHRSGGRRLRFHRLRSLPIVARHLGYQIQAARLFELTPT